EIVRRLPRNLVHGRARNDQRQLLDAGFGKDFGAGLDAHRKAVFVQPEAVDGRTLFGVMAVPAAPDDQRTAHPQLLRKAAGAYPNRPVTPAQNHRRKTMEKGRPWGSGTRRNADCGRTASARAAGRCRAARPSAPSAVWT